MKAAWRRDQFFKPPPFKNPWKDRNGRMYVFVRREKIRWAIANSNTWDDNDILCHVRVGGQNTLPSEEDVIEVKRGESVFRFKVLRVFREVGRRRSKPMQVVSM